MTANGQPSAHWTNSAYWTPGQSGDIALRVALAQEPHDEFEVLLKPATARQLIIVLTRLLMERDREP